MNIAIIGQGKMGKGIVALMPKGWNVKLTCDIDNPLKRIEKTALDGIDLFFEFTEPNSAKANLEYIFGTKMNAKVVCGTTGWDVKDLKELIKKSGAFVIYSANFSLGINSINNILGPLTTLLNKNNGFNISMDEYHHIHKKDSPSGTAKLLANTLNAKGQECQITSFREGEIPGTHIIKFNSDQEIVEIKHEVRSRDVFCKGAVLSAQWLAEQKEPGIYNFNDVIRSALK